MIIVEAHATTNVKVEMGKLLSNFSQNRSQWKQNVSAREAFFSW